MNNKNQEICFKKEVLERIIKAFLSDKFEESVALIPFEMRPKGYEVHHRCCIHKERAILRDRVIAGLGFSIEADDEITALSSYAKKALEREYLDNKHLTLIETACKGCVPDRIYITDLCQGCVATSCKTACKFGAVNIINGKAKIDSSKCRNCKMCISACPYNAIVKITVPCEDVCPVDAIKKNENNTAKIDYNICISCGKCVMACPFGAVHEKSQIIYILKKIKDGKKVIAMTAPSMVGQFPGSVYQLKSALKKAGFYDIYEVAEGADITARREAHEFYNRINAGESFMTTSCCAGYSQFIKKHLPGLKDFVSNTKTPVYYTAEKIKAAYPDCITVFISPCVAKKSEVYENADIDYVSNYEEIAALLSAKNITVSECDEEKFETESSKHGRSFCITGGVAAAVAAALFKGKESSVKPYIVNGLNKETIKKLKKMTDDKKCSEGSLVEVMCCEGGCISGNAVLCSYETARKAVKTLCDKSKDL